MDNLPSKYRFQIRTFLIVILALSVLAILGGWIGGLLYRAPAGQVVLRTIPYDWTGRAIGTGLVAGAISFLLLLNLNKNIGGSMNKTGQSYSHTPGTGRKVVARVIWIVVGVCVLLFLFMFAWLSTVFHG